VDEHLRFDAERWRRRVLVARGEAPADVVLQGGTIVDVLAGDTYVADVAIVDGMIAGVGAYALAESVEDVSGRWLAPSFIDAHIHTESALVWLPEFARAVIPHGTGAVVTDPHEIANIAGLPGLTAMREVAKGLPLGIFFTAPSCVPASKWESPGATFGPEEIAAVLAWDECVGLGELMNFPGVLEGDAGIADRLAISRGMRRDGHAPGLRGNDLHAYVASGPGSDHESSMLDEAWEKLRAGQMVMIREGSSARNLDALLPIVTDATYPRCCFCSDDRDVHALLHEGHMDVILRTVIARGMDPVRAIRLATWNAADYWRLDGWGAVAPGFQANLVVLSDLKTIEVEAVLHQGTIVARSRQMLNKNAPTDFVHNSVPDVLKDTMHLAPLFLSDLRLDPANAKQAVGVIPGEITTRVRDVEPTVVDGRAVADPARDLLKLVCVERHHATGRVGVGYVKGFGLREGAMASSISHDAHNIVAVGANDADVLLAIVTVAELQGGLAVVRDGAVVAQMALPIGGILSDLPLAKAAAEYGAMEEAAKSLGSTLPSPFGLLAFLALSVIPEARVTDWGFIRLG
jgi:adenine deaminase